MTCVYKVGAIVIISSIPFAARSSQTATISSQSEIPSFCDVFLRNRRQNRRTESLYDPMLKAAVESGDDSLVKELMLSGANPALRNSIGQTPVHIAVELRMRTVLDILVRLGAPINMRDNAGLTPLHIAAKLGDYKMCQKLLSAHAQVDCQDYTNHTPLYYASHAGNEAVCSLLVNWDELASDFMHRTASAHTLTRSTQEALDMYYAIALQIDRNMQYNSHRQSQQYNNEDDRASTSPALAPPSNQTSASVNCFPNLPDYATRSRRTCFTAGRRARNSTHESSSTNCFPNLPDYATRSRRTCFTAGRRARNSTHECSSSSRQVDEEQLRQHLIQQLAQNEERPRHVDHEYNASQAIHEYLNRYEDLTQLLDRVKVLDEHYRSTHLNSATSSSRVDPAPTEHRSEVNLSSSNSSSHGSNEYNFIVPAEQNCPDDSSEEATAVEQCPICAEQPALDTMPYCKQKICGRCRIACITTDPRSRCPFCRREQKTK